MAFPPLYRPCHYILFLLALYRFYKYSFPLCQNTSYSNSGASFFTTLFFREAAGVFLTAISLSAAGEIVLGFACSFSRLSAVSRRNFISILCCPFSVMLDLSLSARR